MKTLLRILVAGWISALNTQGAALVAQENWPGWRGPGRDGRAVGPLPPESWSESERVVWRSPVPGRGHSSPVVAGRWVFLTTADDAKLEQSVLAFDRATGERVWQTVVHRGDLDLSLSRQSSHASSTVAWDDGRVYAAFLNGRAVHVSCLDAEGKIVWQRRVSDFVTIRGYGASPLVHGDLLIVNADHKEGGRIVALDKKTGADRWVVERGRFQNYPSPVVMTLDGSARLITAGGNRLTAMDPATGRSIWETEGPTETTVATPVSDGKRIFFSGGFPRSHVSAVNTDGTGSVAWQNSTGIYVPSMLVVGGFVFGFQDTGRAVCWRVEDGEEVWREKLDREFFASPVAAGNLVFASALSGTTFVLRASSQGVSVVSRNVLGNEAFASPAVVEGRIYLRHARTGENREEFLWCIGR